MPSPSRVSLEDGGVRRGGVLADLPLGKLVESMAMRAITSRSSSPSIHDGGIARRPAGRRAGCRRWRRSNRKSPPWSRQDHAVFEALRDERAVDRDRQRFGDRSFAELDDRGVVWLRARGERSRRFSESSVSVCEGLVTRIAAAVSSAADSVAPPQISAMTTASTPAVSWPVGWPCVRAAISHPRLEGLGRARPARAANEARAARRASRHRSPCCRCCAGSPNAVLMRQGRMAGAARARACACSSGMRDRASRRLARPAAASAGVSPCVFSQRR